MFVRLAQLNVLFAPLSEATRGGVDLTTKLADESSSRLSRITGLINEMLGRFHHSIVRVARTSVSLSEVAPHLSHVAAELEQRARQQRENAESIAAASAEMSRTAAAIAQDSSEAEAFSAQVRHATHEANEASTRAEAQIRHIGEGVADLSGQLAALQTSCAAIGQTVQLIKSIADRTRILSLNAAIEAARAGDQGRGFAVVADEVRTLADQTSEATRRVEQVLTGIQQQAGETADAMLRVEREVGAGVDTTVAASACLAGAASHIATLIGHVRAMADASREQGDAVMEVERHVEDVTQGAHRQFDDAHRLSACAAQVRTQTEALLTEIGEFRFDGHRQFRQQVVQTVAQWRLEGLSRSDLELRLVALCRQLPSLQLAYVTDMAGRQVCGNVSPAGVDPRAMGHDWSSRDWFRLAAQDARVYVSGIYRSAATDDFCFTISLPLRDGAGRALGVLGADVRFDHIVGAQGAAAANHSV
ncbi:methyl-accepting chemotaxis protein [Uliginosibacterium sp. sgz301328]|uniref:methyl-accepting chemotaxis protein n=1 Tax=Uliginosibacterium sp. sgz301328 TaxID=3243764 RepID=UPI00359ED9E3